MKLSQVGIWDAWTKVMSWKRVFLGLYALLASTACWCEAPSSLLSAVVFSLSTERQVRWHWNRWALHFTLMYSRPLDNGGKKKTRQIGNGSQIPNPSMNQSGWDSSWALCNCSRCTVLGTSDQTELTSSERLIWFASSDLTVITVMRKHVCSISRSQFKPFIHVR